LNQIPVNEYTAGLLHFFSLVSYRFARLTVPYLYVLGIVEVTMKYFASNSVFEPLTLDHINCPKYWWRNMFHINTLFPVQDMCMIWSWYIANDTQLYIIGAIILIVSIRHFKFAAATLAIFMVAAWITTGGKEVDSKFIYLKYAMCSIFKIFQRSRLVVHIYCNLL
jgi:hypothetical protein